VCAVRGVGRVHHLIRARRPEHGQLRVRGMPDEETGRAGHVAVRGRGEDAASLRHRESVGYPSIRRDHPQILDHVAGRARQQAS